MKILWLVNIVMPELAEHLGRKSSVFGGWLTGAMQAVKACGNNLVVVTTEPNTTVAGRYMVDNVTYYITNQSNISDMEAEFSSILTDECPDVIHIYGTEFLHSLAMANVAEANRTVATIQGSMLYYKDAVYAGLPERICKDNIVHKILRTIHKGGYSIHLQKKSFEERAMFEVQTLKRVGYINGGSEWGNSVARSVKRDSKTLDCKLILRDSFYDGDMWSQEKCEKHSIFVLLSYPIKGFHKFLEALCIICRKYPDVKVYVASQKLNYRNYGQIKSALMDIAPDYQWYLQKYIYQHHLQEHLIFLGNLSEKQMKFQLLKSNVFISPSAIENQSTTLGEAMILGVPSVASCVGAMLEMIHHGEDGFLYPFNEPHLLADYVKMIFENDTLAKTISQKGHDHAARTYDREKNSRDLLKMYETIAENAKEGTR